ncbi:MAG: HlyD family efflux transporter periplasmic adaptor subunit [Cyclobacteriaceae bacterium]
MKNSSIESSSKTNERTNSHNGKALINSTGIKVGGNNELRSAEMQDLMGRSPGWLMKWGVVSLLTIIMLILGLSYFISYPDKVEASATLVSDKPPASIVSLKSGYLILHVEDEQSVTKNSLLGYIVDPDTDYKDISALKRDLAVLKEELQKGVDPHWAWIGQRRLGEIEKTYHELHGLISDLRQIQATADENLEKAQLRKEIYYSEKLNSIEAGQMKLSMEEFLLAKKKYSIDSGLWISSDISESDYLQSFETYLAAKKAKASVELSVLQSEMRTELLKGKVRELDSRTRRKQLQMKQDVIKVLNQIERKVRTWEQQYLLYSPIDGKANLYSIRNSGEHIKSGEEVMWITPYHGMLYAQIKIPANSAGKVQKGQKVIIRLDDYPYGEFGEVEEKVSNISLVSKDQNYLILAELSEKSKTSSRVNLPFRHNMQGQARILVKEERLIQKIFGKLSHSSPFTSN